MAALEALQRYKRIVARNLQDAAFDELRSATPVDTGRARAGWRKGGSGDTLTVSNEVPYIRYLNEGSPSRPPSMFIPRAIRRAVSSVRSRGRLR